MPIVEYFNVIKDVTTCLIAGAEMTITKQLAFEPGEETLHRGAVIGISRSAHALSYESGSQQLPELVGGVLAASVGMKNKDELFAAAGLPLLRIPVQSGYRSVELREQIDSALNG